ncbi:MAG: hypothetical protein KGZ92_07930 [Firmicutes bacterium]|nr:hypothetical protein [Dethiobacter sp.]MBS3889195.1 hypothetical protein [Bacillota bacterium]MBS4055671.1 hypothetical protein [Thermaerobacter sp.]
MQKTIVGVFRSESDAERAVRALRSSGFRDQEISIVAKDRGTQGKGQGQQNRSGMANTMRAGTDDISDGMTSGATWGGLAGLALGTGALAIPGLGPIIAAGPIAAALTGAATGGLAGGLLDWGIPAERGRQLQEEVRQGNMLAILQCTGSECTEAKVNQASNILRENGARDVESHASSARR